MDWIEKHIKIDKKTRFVYPDYKKFGISTIPSTILSLFGIKTKRRKLSKKAFIDEDVENVILFLIDGFGYNRFLELRKVVEPLKKLVDNSIVTQLTSVFPSTTANAITTFITGLTPQEHAIPELFFYCKELDSFFYPFFHPQINYKRVEEMYLLDFATKNIFPKQNIFNVLEKENVKTFSLIESPISNSMYTKSMLSFSKVVPYEDLADMVVKLKKILSYERGKKFIYVYTSIVDTISHLYGTKSPYYEQDIENIFYVFWEHFIKKVSSKILRKTEIFITSDHGQMNFDKRKLIYLNTIEGIEKFMKRDKNGNIIGVAGSPRDLFFYAKKGSISKAREMLVKKLKDYAYITTAKRLVRKGLFGYGKENKKFLDRVGDIIIIPYNSNTLWLQNYAFDISQFKSFHGGLSAEEMLVPLIVYKK